MTSRTLDRAAPDEAIRSRPVSPAVRPMKIVIRGGSGQVGTLLAEALHSSGDTVVVLTRRPELADRSSGWRSVGWNGMTGGPWVEELEAADVVINLAGRSVNCRYDARNRRDILDSRVQSTRIIGQTIAGLRRPPSLWLQASTATIYAHRFDAGNDEASGVIGGTEPGVPAGWRFSIDVAQAWEQACRAVPTPGTRKVLLRSAITLSPHGGGIFDALAGLVRVGLGGTMGDGRQFVSWIHGRDFVRSVRWLIERDDIHGVVNTASPNPLPNAEFMRTLREAAGRRVGLPASRWMLTLGALVRRTETELLLKSRRVVPARLLSAGFEFVYPDWREAAVDLWHEWQRCRGARGSSTV